MKNRKAKKNVLVLWGIISIVLIIYGLKDSISNISLLILGEIVSGIGIMRTFKHFSGWIVFDIGLCLLLFPVARLFGYDFVLNSSIKNVALAFGIILATQLFFDDSLRNKSAKKRCTVPFQAKCISFEESYNSIYIPVYRYHIEGKTNTFYGNNLYSVNPKLGDVLTVFVNKKNENDIYCPTSKAILMLRYMIGMLLIAFSTGALIIL